MTISNIVKLIFTVPFLLVAVGFALTIGMDYEGAIQEHADRCKKTGYKKERGRQPGASTQNRTKKRNLYL